MSAKKRAFSRVDRESLQEAIDANHPSVEVWVRKREEKLQYLEKAISPSLLEEAQSAISLLSRSVNQIEQPQVVKELWVLIDTLEVWRRLTQKPRNVRAAALEITNNLNSALEKLVYEKVWTRQEAK
jgi:hypothetical protein